MSDLLTRAFERVRALPPDVQDDFARLLLRLTGDEEPVYVLSAEEEVSLEVARAQSAKGEFASDDEMRVIWAKHGL